MKRPALLISFVYSVCIGFSIYLGVKTAICLCTLFFAVFLVIIFIKPIRRQTIYPLCCFVAALGFGVFSVVNTYSVIPVTNALNGLTTDISVLMKLKT